MGMLSNNKFQLLPLARLLYVLFQYQGRTAMTAKQFNIVISGAGAAGLTLAVLLAKSGLKVAVIDPADKSVLADDSLSGRTVALMNGSLNILKAVLGNRFYRY